MKKSWIVFGSLALLILIIFGSLSGSYNGMIQRSEDIKSALSKIETQYQRRGDLVDNLVNTVKGSADFEKSTLIAVIDARSQATKISLNSDDLTPEKIAAYQKAQAQLGGSLNKLLLTVEQYPNFKASEAFLKLQDELAGTENRIAVARDNFNEAAKIYNVYIQTFPKNIIAGIFNFHPKGYFETTPENRDVPKIKF